MISPRSFLLLSALALGCSRPVPSPEIPLFQMHFEARALAVSASWTEVRVRLWRSGTYRKPVALAGGDRHPNPP